VQERWPGWARKPQSPSLEADEPPLFPVRKSSEETRSALSARKSARCTPKTERSGSDEQVKGKKELVSVTIRNLGVMPRACGTAGLMLRLLSQIVIN
jgi:hypothetical protein